MNTTFQTFQPAPLLTREQLYDQFEQAMALPVDPAGEMRLRGALQALMGELLACRAGDPRAKMMLLACRLRLRALQNMILARREDIAFAPQRCDLRTWTEDLCAAADMLLHPLGRSVRFDDPEEIIEAPCAPRDIGWLLLELICNCARHCPGEEIVVTLTCKRWRRRPVACVLKTECRGELDLPRLHAAGACSGTAALRRVAALHRGSLLWLGCGGLAVAALRLPLREPGSRWLASRGQEMAETPDFVELLSDQTSMVYTALAPVTGELGGALRFCA
ncbi:MAG: hypothetical protein LBG83_00295 [Oscillospiraceae bacterium]|jgi:hypothetical protein|nr:hypothetical protein [Oscillospiraceae bacterium]